MGFSDFQTPFGLAFDRVSDTMYVSDWGLDKIIAIKVIQTTSKGISTASHPMSLLYTAVSLG